MNGLILSKTFGEFEIKLTEPDHNIYVVNIDQIDPETTDGNSIFQKIFKQYAAAKSYLIKNVMSLKKNQTLLDIKGI